MYIVGSIQLSNRSGTCSLLDIHILELELEIPR